MGISLNKNDAFTITDRNGNTKFSLDKRMPHIIGDFSGTVYVPQIYTTGVPYTTAIIDRTDEIVTLSNSYITNDDDSFILPFYSISGGVSDTSGKIISGIGSTLVRKIIQPTTKDFLGSSILDIVIDNGELKIVCNQHIDKTGFSNIDGDIPVTISYRIYYGRFK
jgi:hypothetical protein